MYPHIQWGCFARSLLKVQRVNETSNAAAKAIYWEYQITVLMHEMTHAFGFDSNWASNWINWETNPVSRYPRSSIIADDSGYQTLIHPYIRKFVREYHNCYSIAGLRLEDAPNGGFHPEARFYPVEATASFIQDDSRYTNLTLVVLNATGWWHVNFTYAEPSGFGRVVSCNFFTTSMPLENSKYSQYCPTSGKVGCTPNGRSWGPCGKVTNGNLSQIHKMVNAPYGGHSCKFSSSPVSNFQEEYGMNSRCFEGDLTFGGPSPNSADHYCLEYTCKLLSSGDYSLTIHVNDVDVLCPGIPTKDVPAGNYGTVNCPAVQNYCKGTGATYCPRNCMGKGKCNAGKCKCETGWVGDDCSQRNSSTYKYLGY